jgi:8-oxo-dGTP diphosphatase
MQGRPEIHVMAGVLSDDRGRVLIAQRPAGKHLAGRWEFPGGKLAEGEAPVVGLRRELAEELGVTLGAAEPLIRLRHDYHDRRVLLDVWRVTGYSGAPRGLDGQALDWVTPDDLPGIDLLEADRPIITALRLPVVARCISGLEGLKNVQPAVQVPHALFWSPQGAERTLETAREAVQAARRAGHRVIVTGEDIEAAMTAAATGADGMLLEPTSGMLTIDPRGAFLVGAMCATPAAAEAAVASGAHFLVLAPGGAEAGEGRFVGVLQQAGVPAYLGWYPDAESLELARASGAHGCAVGPFSAPASERQQA